MDTIKQLKQYIKKNALKQHEVARQLDISEATLNRWLRGKSKISEAWRRVVNARFEFSDDNSSQKN